MERLGIADMRRAMGLLRGMYEVRGFDGFVAHLLASLPSMVRAEVVSYNEMLPADRQSKNWVTPEELNTPERGQRWMRVMHQHPSLNHYHRSGDTRALRLSDFLSGRQFRSLALYADHYRGIGAEDCLTLPLQSAPGAVDGVALHRGGKFSGRDKLMLNCVRPHLIEAHHSARAVDRLMRDNTMLDRALGGTSNAMAVLGPSYRIRLATGLARKWLAEYFDPAGQADRLPETLELWVRYHSAKLRELPAARAPLVLNRERKRLSIRLLSEADESILLLEEHRESIDAASLLALGLTPRQSQVLAAASSGLGLRQVASALAMSPRTVQTHLQAIYRKLGVESRSAAVAAAFRASLDDRIRRRDEFDPRAELEQRLSAKRSGPVVR